MVGLSMALRLFLLAICIVLFVLVVRLIRQGRLQIRYSLLWFVLALLMLLCAVFPPVVSAAAGLFGFEYSSNFIFSVGIVILLAICLSLSLAVSWQARYIRSLVQKAALLDNRLSELEKKRESQNESSDHDDD